MLDLETGDQFHSIYSKSNFSLRQRAYINVKYTRRVLVMFARKGSVLRPLLVNRTGNKI